jgi:uncharacterized tellurite resistance protein B-like protein
MLFSKWIDRISAAQQQGVKPESPDLERISAALLVEVARSDHKLETEELQTIKAALENSSSSLSVSELEQIIDEVLAEADATISLHAHIRQINEHFDRQQKIQLIEQMWRVAYTDGDLDKYEDYTIRKLSELLYLKHRDFVQAKLAVLEQ